MNVIKFHPHHIPQRDEKEEGWRLMESLPGILTGFFYFAKIQRRNTVVKKLYLFACLDITPILEMVRNDNSFGFPPFFPLISQDWLADISATLIVRMGEEIDSLAKHRAKIKDLSKHIKSLLKLFWKDFRGFCFHKLFIQQLSMVLGAELISPSGSICWLKNKTRVFSGKSWK